METMVCIDHNGIMHINEEVPGDVFYFNEAGNLIGIGGDTEYRRVGKAQLSKAIKALATENSDFFGLNEFHYRLDDIEVLKYKTGWYLIKKKYHVEMDWVERQYIIVDKTGKTYSYWRFIG